MTILRIATDDQVQVELDEVFRHVGVLLRGRGGERRARKDYEGESLVDQEQSFGDYVRKALLRRNQGEIS